MVEFTNALKSRDCTLKTLHLYENRLGVEDARELAMVLRQNESMDTLILNQCEIDCEAIKALVGGLEGNTTLKSINLWDNRIGDEGAKALAEAIETYGTQLQTLNLWGNKIGNEGAVAFAELLRNNQSALRDLILVYNEIGDEGGDDLVDALDQNEGIRNLDLFGNPLDQAIIMDVYCLINDPLRCSYEGGLNKDDDRGRRSENALEGLSIDKSCLVSLGGAEGAAADTESTASPTGVGELSGCCWTDAVSS